MIAAIVILYHPDIASLERSLARIIPQVQCVFLIDNTPADISVELANLVLRAQESIRYMPLASNLGIASAQNIAIAECLGAGYSHLLLLDQDSLPPDDLVERLLRAECDLLQAGMKVGAVGPLFVDVKSQQRSYAVRYGWFRARKISLSCQGSGPVEADWLISAGSLIRSSVLVEVGSMREDLFIDWVDAEWGLRARNLGFRSYIVPDAVMEHSVGDDSREIFGRSINLHNSVRNYYIVRNATYLLRPWIMSWKWTTAMSLRIPRYVAVHSWYSKHRWRNLKNMLMAIADGVCGKLGPASK
jgi:rhamnosyltransferase